MTSLPAVDDLLDTMETELRVLCKQRRLSAPAMIGIHSGGVWIAERLHRALALAEPLGTLDISFYRDDFSRVGMHPQVHPSRLPFAVDDRDIILVDDVLYTGRTVRAALNTIFDYGRPASVMLVVLVDRGGRELPIAPDVAGCRLELGEAQQIKLSGPAPLTLTLTERNA
jgi:pyrimidine operon attenuation protein / uracil phosphoribosyltransferase